jgi:hypothetical protein
MGLIVKLARKLDIDVMSISAADMEEIEDRNLLCRMEAARAEGFADTDEVLKKLGL